MGTLLAGTKAVASSPAENSAVDVKKAVAASKRRVHGNVRCHWQSSLRCSGEALEEGALVKVVSLACK